MEWKDLGSAVAKAAPLVGQILTGNIPGAVVTVGSIIASAFGVDNAPDAIHAAIQADPAAAVKLAEIEAGNRLELQRLAVASASNELAAETARLAEVNVTMRAEANSSDPWSRRWRPYIGFVTGTAFGVVCLFTMLLLGLAIFMHSSEAMNAIPTVITTMTALFAVPGAILGVASWHRGVAEVARARQAG